MLHANVYHWPEKTDLFFFKKDGKENWKTAKLCCHFSKSIKRKLKPTFCLFVQIVHVFIVKVRECFSQVVQH